MNTIISLAPVPYVGELVELMSWINPSKKGAKGGKGGTSSTKKDSDPSKPDCQCLPKGTLVHTVDGKRPIEQLKRGDLVYARDAETGAVRLQPITELYVTHGKVLYAVTLKIGEGESIRVESTADHPYGLTDGQWRETEALQAGDHVLARDGELEVVAVERLDRVEETYNIEVAGDHSYFVGDVGVLVHNGIPCVGSTPGGRKISEHAATDSLERHRFNDLKEIDEIIDGYSFTVEQADGATAYIKKSGKGAKLKYSVVIIGGDGVVVTAVKNFTKQELKAMGRNNGWEYLGF